MKLRDRPLKSRVILDTNVIIASCRGRGKKATQNEEGERQEKVIITRLTFAINHTNNRFENKNHINLPVGR